MRRSWWNKPLEIGPRTLVFIAFVVWPILVSGLVVAMRPQALPRIELCWAP
jgi:hypothetical protein